MASIDRIISRIQEANRESARLSADLQISELRRGVMRSPILTEVDRISRISSNRSTAVFNTLQSRTIPLFDRINRLAGIQRNAERTLQRLLYMHKTGKVPNNNNKTNSDNNNVQERSPNLSKQITNEEWNNNNTEVEIRMKKLKTYTPRQQKYLMKVDKKIYDSRDLQQWINSGRETIPHSRNPITARLRARIDKRVQGISNNNNNNNNNNELDRKND